MCKPQKANGAKKNKGLQEVGKVGFSNQKKVFLAGKDEKDV